VRSDAGNLQQQAAIGSDPFFTSRRVQFVTFSARHAIPLSSQALEFGEAGAVMSYEPTS